jgi:hypothetical protein
MLRPHACRRACAAPDGMRPGAPKPPLAPHAGGTGAPHPRVRGVQPRHSIGMIQTLAATNAGIALGRDAVTKPTACGRRVSAQRITRH